MVIIFIHNLQNRKPCKVVVRYLAEISQLMHLMISAKLQMLMITCQTQRETVFMLKNFKGSKKSLKIIVSQVQFVIFNLQKQPPRGVLWKMCSENMKQIYRRTPMLRFQCVFSCKLAAYFQNTFSKEHLWTVASQSIKSPVRLLRQRLLRFFCSVIWLDERSNWRICKLGLFFKIYCFFEMIFQLFKNYFFLLKLLNTLI